MHLRAAAVAVSGWWKSILDGGYSRASSHISLDMNLRLRSTCRSSPFGFSFLVSFVLLPATSTVSTGNTFLPPSLHPFKPGLVPLVRGRLRTPLSYFVSLLSPSSSLSRFLLLAIISHRRFY